MLLPSPPPFAPLFRTPPPAPSPSPPSRRLRESTHEIAIERRIERDSTNRSFVDLRDCALPRLHVWVLCQEEEQRLELGGQPRVGAVKALRPGWGRTSDRGAHRGRRDRDSKRKLVRTGPWEPHASSYRAAARRGRPRRPAAPAARRASRPPLPPPARGGREGSGRRAGVQHPHSPTPPPAPARAPPARAGRGSGQPDAPPRYATTGRAACLRLRGTQPSTLTALCAAAARCARALGDAERRAQAAPRRPPLRRASAATLGPRHRAPI